MESASKHPRNSKNLSPWSAETPSSILIFPMKKTEKPQYPLLNLEISTPHGPKKSTSIKFKYLLKLFFRLKELFSSKTINSGFLTLKIGTTKNFQLAKPDLDWQKENSQTFWKEIIQNNCLAHWLEWRETEANRSWHEHWLQKRAKINCRKILIN